MSIIPNYLRERPASFHTRILVGPGAFLSETFVRVKNITHVINCAFDSDSPSWWRERYPDKYVCLNAIDSPSHNIVEWYPKFEETMRNFLREGSGIVYVHCQAGINRSASLALIYVVKNFHHSLSFLKTAVSRQRPCMFQNVVFMKQVEQFINGCIQSEEDPRNPTNKSNDGNT